VLILIIYYFKSWK